MTAGTSMSPEGATGPLASDGARRTWTTFGVVAGALLILAVFIWQGVTASGSPDPTLPHTSAPVAILDIGVLVFREGLECVLVLAAITAGLMGTNQSYRRPIGLGAIVGFAATLITWLIAVHIVDDLTQSVSALSLQAWTGLLAIVVLLIVMNWFFHKVYWTGWISFQNRRKRALVQGAEGGLSQNRVFTGLLLLGFASFYREGFEVVLFLQSYRLQMGNGIVFFGVLLGAFFAGIVAVVTFVAHHRLPYKRMLVLTGVLLVFVLIMMVGEQVNEMQLAGWIGTTNISWLQWLPDWAGLWLSLFPNVQTVVAQLIAVVAVIGSYAVSRYQAVSLPKKVGVAPFAARQAPPTANPSGTSVPTATGAGA